MNKLVYDLVMALLGSDLSKDSKDEIVRFYLLPRNTPVRPIIEMPDENVREELGPIKRLDAKAVDRLKHPENYEGADAVAETLRGKLGEQKNEGKKS